MTDNKLPAWSSLTEPMEHTVKTATVGSFVACYFNPTLSNGIQSRKAKPSVLLVERCDGRLGLPGGYVDIGSNNSAGEQLAEGAVRELREEVVNAEGTPIIAPDAQRLQIISAGIDYKNPALPVCYHGHALELTAEELVQLQEHAQKLTGDEQYKQASFVATHNEVRGIKILPISEIMQMPEQNFAYPHEFAALKTLHEKLLGNKQSLYLAG